MFTLTIETDNAAFEDDPGGEVARMLDDLTASISVRGLDEATKGKLRDSNGNTVGQWSYEP